MDTDKQLKQALVPMIESILHFFKIHQKVIFGNPAIIVEDMLGKTPKTLDAVDMIFGFLVDHVLRVIHFYNVCPSGQAGCSEAAHIRLFGVVAKRRAQQRRQAPPLWRGAKRFRHNVPEYAKLRRCFQHKLPLSDDCILVVSALNFKKRSLGEENSDTLLKVKKLSLFSEPHTRCYRM